MRRSTSVPSGRKIVVTNIHPTSEASIQVPGAFLTLMEKQLIGSLFGSGNIRKDIPRLMELYTQGQLNLDDLITRRTRSIRSTRATTRCATARTSAASSCSTDNESSACWVEGALGALSSGSAGYGRRREHSRTRRAAGRHRRRTPTRDRSRRRRPGCRSAHPARGSPGHRQVDAAALGRPRARSRFRVRRRQCRTDTCPADRPLRPRPGAGRRVRPRRVRRRPAGGGVADRLAAVRRGAQSGSGRDAQCAGHRDERARTQRAAARSPGRSARISSGGRDEPVRRRRNGPDLVGDL